MTATTIASIRATPVTVPLEAPLLHSNGAHYHHLVDDVITGGLMRYENGAIRVPDAPGLGITLDREKLRQYHELYKKLGGYPYDRDPGRPDWYPLVPNTRWADPTVSLRPSLDSQNRGAAL